ncbi:MAG: protease inhibitor I9 family protein [Oscillospiraceae bacterium]|nr:protease inhibitor I9 family protein [Oscillospiraceae bacterium]
MIKKIITVFVSAAAALSLTANAVFAALPIENAAVYDGDETVTFIVEVEGDALLASDAAAELGTDYIGTEEAQEQETEILKAQAKVLSDIQSEAKVKESKGYTYTAVLNGFSIVALRIKMDVIKAIDGVKNVIVA